MQEDEDANSTSRVPIALAGLNCAGSEQTIGACADFQLGQVGTKCRHNADVHLVCYNAPNPGALALYVLGALRMPQSVVTTATYLPMLDVLLHVHGEILQSLPGLYLPHTYTKHGMHVHA